MDLITFNEVVVQFNTKYPSNSDGAMSLIEELGEMAKEISLGNKKEAAKEAADALFVLLGIIHNHSLPLEDGLQAVALKNHKKIVEDSLVLGPNGKWLKKEDAEKVVQ